MNPGGRVGAPSVREEASRLLQPSLPFSERHYGAALTAELNELSRESDPGLYREGLLSLAQRQVREGRPEVAAELFQDLLSVSPTGSSEAVRAQQGLDAILGRGAVGNRVEFLLRNFAQQAAEPSSLLAMTAAGAVFRMTRLATLSRLTAEANPGFLTRLLGAGRIASVAGFVAEAPTFTLAGRLTSEALGRPQDWSGRAFGRDLASSYLVLGGLRFVGAAGQGIAARTQAGPLLSGLVHQGSMLTGILLSHRLETLAGLRANVDGATTLTDSLVLLLQFHVAGNLTRSAFGPRFAAWETGLDRQAATLERGLRLEFPNSSSPQLALAGFSAGRISRPRSTNPLEMTHLMMVKGGNGEGDGGKDGIGSDPPNGGDGARRRNNADTTTSFTIAREQRAEEGALPHGIRDPFQVDSPAQLVRRIQDPELNFRESLRDGDMEFHIKPVPSTDAGPISRVERYIPPILLHLTAISIGASIPDGRRLIIVQEGALERRYTLTKQGGRFECFPPLAEEPSGETHITRPTPRRLTESVAEVLPVEAVTKTKTPVPAADSNALVMPPAAEPVAAEVKVSLEEEEARSIPLRTHMAETLPRTLALAARQAARRGGGPGQVLLEHGTLTLAQLEQFGIEAGSDLSEGTTFKVFVPESQAIFQGRMEAQGLRWELVGDEKAWEPATIFSSVTVRSVLEIYQTLRAYSRSQISPNTSELVIRFRGPSPTRDHLVEFISSTLDQFSPAGRDSLRVEFDSGEPELRFHRLESGRWEPN